MSVERLSFPSRTVARSTAAVGAVAAISLIFGRVIPVNPTTAGFLYLITTLLVASRWGLAEAIVVSVVATVCLNFFFFPPLHTFVIAEPQNWVALFTFLFASLLASQLSERAKRRAAEALRRQQDLERLHVVSRAILQCDGTRPVAEQLAAEIVSAYGLSSAAIYDRTADRIFHAGAADLPAGWASEELLSTAKNGGTLRNDQDLAVVTAFGPGDGPAGSLALTGAPIPNDALESLSNLVAIGLEKARNQEAATRADAARQMQEFKSTLLDALAHEFKTPLTTITAATSAMLAPGVADPLRQQEYLALIDQEADRLARLVSDAIQLARIEAGTMHLDRQPHGVSSLVERAVEQMATAPGGREIDVHIADGLPSVRVDAPLLQLALRQLIDNALKYSPPRAQIRVSVEADLGFVSLAVWNSGQTIPAGETARLFEKFYRGSTASKTAGTGMGLAIVKDIISAHGGQVRITSDVPRGTQVSILIPVEREAAAV